MTAPRLTRSWRTRLVLLQPMTCQCLLSRPLTLKRRTTEIFQELESNGQRLAMCSFAHEVRNAKPSPSPTPCPATPLHSLRVCQCSLRLLGAHPVSCPAAVCASPGLSGRPPPGRAARGAPRRRRAQWRRVRLWRPVSIPMARPRPRSRSLASLSSSRTPRPRPSARARWMDASLTVGE
jgi:hypothetical protein